MTAPDLGHVIELALAGHPYTLRPGIELTVELPPRARRRRARFVYAVPHADAVELVVYDGRQLRTVRPAQVVTVHRTTGRVPAGTSQPPRPRRRPR